MLGLVLVLLPLTRTWTALLPGIVTSVLIVYVAASDSPLWKKLIASRATALCLLTLLAATLISWQHPDAFQIINRLLLSICLLPLIAFLFREHSAVLLVSLLMLILLQGLWGGAQFVLQEDLGHYLLGETQLVPGGTGLATFSVHKFFRAYGPYGHPNVLAGILSLGLLLYAGYPQLVRKAPLRVVYWLLWLSLLLTFSRAGLLAGLLALALLLAQQSLSRALRVRVAAVVLLVSVALLPLWYVRGTDINDQAVSERQQGLELAAAVWQRQNPLLGTGVGNYTNVLQETVAETGVVVRPWEIAPVHSVPLLLLLEWGILLGSLLAVGLISLHWPLVRQRWLLLLPLLPTLLLDHYWYTAPAATVLLFATLQLLGSAPARYTS